MLLTLTYDKGTHIIVYYKHWWKIKPKDKKHAFNSQMFFKSSWRKTVKTVDVLIMLYSKSTAIVMNISTKTSKKVMWIGIYHYRIHSNAYKFNHVRPAHPK